MGGGMGGCGGPGMGGCMMPGMMPGMYDDYDPQYDPNLYYDKEGKFSVMAKPRVSGHRYGPEDRDRDAVMMHLIAQDMPFYGDDYVPKEGDLLAQRQHGRDPLMMQMNPYGPMMGGAMVPGMMPGMGGMSMRPNVG